MEGRLRKAVAALAAAFIAADAVLVYVWWTRRIVPAPPAAPAAQPAAGPSGEGAPPPRAVEERPLPPPGPDPDRMPGGCRSLSECEEYCAEAAHRQECVDFMGPVETPTSPPAEPSGEGVPPPHAVRERPCQGEECRAYCSDPAHAAECRELGRAERKRAAESVKAAPAAVQDCLRRRLGAKTYARLLRAQVQPERVSEAMTACFAAARSGGEGGMKGNPGGCATQAGCVAYCTKPENRDECLAWDGLPEKFREMLEGGGEE